MIDGARKKTNLESHLLVQIAVPFKIQYLQKCLKVPTEKYAFPTTKNNNDFIIFNVSNLVFIYFGDSTSNFRILYLILNIT